MNPWFHRRVADAGIDRMSAASPPLLATKLTPPRRRRGTVERRRLTDRARGDLPALVLVSAPAGFGKTTFLTALLEAGPDRRTAWLALDAGDNDPAVFWAYLLAAVRSTDPAGELDPGGAGEATLGTDAVASLVNDLAARPDEVVLVLDDYHVVVAPEIHEAVAFLVEHLPPNAHLVLASRSDPPLPLARLRARGDLLEVRAADLRFTAEEAARAISRSVEAHSGDADVAPRSEAWRAALAPWAGERG